MREREGIVHFEGGIVGMLFYCWAFLMPLFWFTTAAFGKVWFDDG